MKPEINPACLFSQEIGKSKNGVAYVFRDSLQNGLFVEEFDSIDAGVKACQLATGFFDALETEFRLEMEAQ